MTTNNNTETITTLVHKQREFFNTQETKKITFRINALKKLRQAIKSQENTLNKAIWTDLHKSPYEFYLTETSIILQEIDYHIHHLNKWSKPQKAKTPFTLFPSKSYTLHEPFGIVLIIAPWNYPLQLLINPLIGAISAGNCAILKSSPYAPATSAALKKIITTHFEDKYIALVEGGRETNQQLLNQRFDYIFFTGSPALGRIVMEAAAKNLTPVTLELGGKSPCIVDKSADIHTAAKRVIWGKLINAGQTCIAPDYLLVHQDIKKQLLETLQNYIKIFFGNNPETSPDFGRIINEKAMQRLLKLLENGKIIEGGKFDLEKRYIAPTIIDEITPDSPIMQEEIFGPLLPVMTFNDLDQVIQFINQREKPLALYYFGSRREAKKILQQTTSGGICINDTLMHIANPYLPFGGVGNSGLGKYHGQYSFECFSNKRAVLISRTWFDIFLKYPPYRNLKLLKKLL